MGEAHEGEVHNIGVLNVNDNIWTRIQLNEFLEGLQLGLWDPIEHGDSTIFHSAKVASEV